MPFLSSLQFIIVVVLSFVVCQNSHILFGTLSLVSFTWYFVICCAVFCHLSFRLLLLCHSDFYLVLEKRLNFFSRTLESRSEPALDVDKTGDVLALVQVSPGLSILISRKTFAEKIGLKMKSKIFPSFLISQFQKAHLLEGP